MMVWGVDRQLPLKVCWPCHWLSWGQSGLRGQPLVQICQLYPANVNEQCWKTLFEGRSQTPGPQWQSNKNSWVAGMRVK